MLNVCRFVTTTAVCCLGKVKNPAIKAVFVCIFQNGRFECEETFEMKESVIEYIKSDLYRYYGTTSCATFLKAYLTSRIFRYQVAWRLQRSSKWGWHQLGIILWLCNTSRYTLQISRKASIGYGLYIGHYAPIIVNPTTVIGNNCNISQNLTIGSNEGQAAHIGNNVYIGPNVCIVENVHISDNVTIGAGSVVTKDIPMNATAAGNYAKVLNYNRPARYIGNRWKI